MRQLVVLCVTVFLCASDAPATVSTVSIFSPSNGRDVGFQIYTPPGYASDPAKRYPIVFSLHGIGGLSLQRASLYAPTLDARISSGEILPMIWVFPDGQENSFYGDAFDGHKQVYSNVIGEVLPYVEANYRSIANRLYRAMEGFSMGGYGAVLYAAKHPELFSASVEYGGPLGQWQDLMRFNRPVAEEMFDAVEANYLPYSIWDVTTSNAAALRTQVNFKMIVGDQDAQLQSNLRFRDHLQNLGIDPHFQILPGVEHVGGAYLSEASGLRFLSQHFASMFRVHGDYTHDGRTDAEDFAAWKEAFGSSDLAADGNADGIVDAADYIVWRKSVGASAGVNADIVDEVSEMAVPEPGSGVSLAFGALAVLFCGGGRFDGRRPNQMSMHPRLVNLTAARWSRV
jgi:S-formylglutathione hydrolase FrmB